MYNTIILVHVVWTTNNRDLGFTQHVCLTVCASMRALVMTDELLHFGSSIFCCIMLHIKPLKVHRASIASLDMTLSYM